MFNMIKIKARKSYQCATRCDVCIPVGATYIRVAEILDGKWHHSKWHTECREEFDDMLRQMGECEGAADWAWDDKGVPQDLIDKYNSIAFENIVLKGK